MRLVAILLLSSVALAGPVSAPPTLGPKVSIRLRGMVCSFCAQGVKKKLSALPAVKDTQVSLAEGKVTVLLNNKSELSDETIRKTLKDSGFDVEKIER